MEDINDAYASGDLTWVPRTQEEIKKQAVLREWFINQVSQKMKEVGINSELDWSKYMQVSIVGTYRDCSVCHYNLYTEDTVKIVVARLQIELEDSLDSERKNAIWLAKRGKA